MFLSHPYKILFLIRHKDKKDLTEHSLKILDEAACKLLNLWFRHFSFCRPAQSGDKQKSEDITTLLSKRLQLPQAVVDDTLIYNIIMQGRKRIKKVWLLFLPRARRRTVCGLFLKSLTKPPRRGMMKKSNPVPPREVDAMTREEAINHQKRTYEALQPVRGSSL